MSSSRRPPGGDSAVLRVVAAEVLDSFLDGALVGVLVEGDVAADDVVLRGRRGLVSWCCQGIAIMGFVWWRERAGGICYIRVLDRWDCQLCPSRLRPGGLGAEKSA